MKYKLLIIGVFALALLFAGLFAITFVQFRSLQREKEKAASSASYLHKEEAVVVTPENKTEEPVCILVKPVLFEYIKVSSGCGPYFIGECINMRSGPGKDYPVMLRLRDGTVLKVGGMVERDGQAWYKIVFDEWIRYPERITGDRYVSTDYVQVLYNEGARDISAQQNATTTKRIVVDRAEQMLYAYDGDELFTKEPISTGVELNPTPRGTFIIFKKTPSRYMQGPIPGVSEQFWDLPGVPWNLYFSNEGAVIHGAYWHDNFGKPSSHGCVNLPPEQAEKLYMWADLGTKVIVQN